MIISVIIPTFNRATVLPRAIQSVLNQSFSDFEIIVVDDASVDNTSDVMKDFTDERIVYIRHSTNKGGAAARNTAIDSCRGDFIAFLDSDDEWLPQKLQMQLDAFRRLDASCGVVYTAIKAIYDNGTTEVLPATLRGDFLHELLISNCIRTLSSVMVRRHNLRSVGGFDPWLRSCQDWDLYIRLMKESNFESINEPLTVYHVNKEDPARISNTRQSIVQGHEAIAAKFADDYKKLTREERVRYFESVSEMYILGGNLSHPFAMMMDAFALTGNFQYLIKAFYYVGRYGKSKFRKTHGY